MSYFMETNSSPFVFSRDEMNLHNGPIKGSPSVGRVFVIRIGLNK